MNNPEKAVISEKHEFDWIISFGKFQPQIKKHVNEYILYKKIRTSVLSIMLNVLSDFENYSFIKAPSILKMRIHVYVFLRYDLSSAMAEDTGFLIRYPGTGTLLLANERHNLLNVQMHTPAEHRVDGADSVSLEVQFYHESQRDGSITVVSVLCQENYGSPNMDFFGPLEDGLPGQPRSGSLQYHPEKIFENLDTNKYHR